MSLTKQPYKNWSNALSNYTYDEWFDKYQPITNEFTGYGENHFETFGEEYDFVQNSPEDTVWTEVDGDGGTYIVNGLCFVNRIHYYVTKVPAENEIIEVPTWVYSECDCVTEENDYNAIVDCPDCNGDGVIDIPCDTREDLEKIYGANK
jgi:hypothetical protein